MGKSFKTSRYSMGVRFPSSAPKFNLEMSHRLVARTVSGDGWPGKCLLLVDAIAVVQRTFGPRWRLHLLFVKYDRLLLRSAEAFGFNLQLSGSPSFQ